MDWQTPVAMAVLVALWTGVCGLIGVARDTSGRTDWENFKHGAIGGNLLLIVVFVATGVVLTVLWAFGVVYQAWRR